MLASLLDRAVYLHPPNLLEHTRSDSRAPRGRQGSRHDPLREAEDLSGRSHRRSRGREGEGPECPYERRTHLVVCPVLRSSVSVVVGSACLMRVFRGRKDEVLVALELCHAIRSVFRANRRFPQSRMGVLIIITYCDEHCVSAGKPTPGWIHWYVYIIFNLLSIKLLYNKAPKGKTPACITSIKRDEINRLERKVL